MRIIIDFETYSGYDIDVGSYKYMHHPDADIICMGYKIEDERTELWKPGIPLPAAFFEDDTILVAHNALFDFIAWHVIGCTKYNFPERPLAGWIDSQALTNRYTLPGGLAKAGDILGVSVQKDKQGKVLIKRICTPDKDGNRPTVWSADMLAFYNYCKQDVDSTYELIKALPSSQLASDEQDYWVCTQEMNLAGLPVDEQIVDKILSYIESFAEEMTRRVPEITHGTVEKVTQVQRMVKYIKSRGIDISNLQAGTVDKLLEAEIPDDVRELLVLRQTIGRSSTAKYRKIKEMAYGGRVYNNLLYYGASTGRWTGRGFQLHNLPRASVPDPEKFIDRFDNFEPVDDPVNVAKALIRPMIRSEPDYSLIVSDYSAIENRLLAWVAGDEKSLELFRTGGDQYVDMAATLYSKSHASVTKQERQMGKVIILGCGYGMGSKRFRETAADWGMDVSDGEALGAVNAYRNKYTEIRSLWTKLKNCAISAIQNPGQKYEYRRNTFSVVKCRAGNRWLVLTLPSGRNLYYMDPYVSDGEYGLNPGHMGTNPYTKKWDRLKLIPGRITENIIQALARDVMAQGLINIRNHMGYIQLIGQCHDEAIGEIQDNHIEEGTLSAFNHCMCMMPEWADGLPLEAEGWIGPRYKK